MVTRVKANGFQNRDRFHKRHLFSKKNCCLFWLFAGWEIQWVCKYYIGRNHDHRIRWTKHMKSAGYKKSDCSVQIGCTYDVMETSFLQNNGFTRRERCKRKNCKNISCKTLPKKPHVLWFYTGLSCAIMIPQNKQKCNERCRQCEIFVWVHENYAISLWYI